MSQKRKRAETAGGDQEIQYPAKKRPSKPGKAYQKSKGNRSHLSQPEPNVTTTRDLKSRIRNLRRLLEHVDNEPKHKMPANVRIERERELETCEHELAEKTATAQAAERRKKMISKYHHVRFFDRRKATRIVKQLKRQLAAQDEAARASKDHLNISELQQRIHDAEVAVNYAIYYPLMKPYSSLYPNTKRDRSKSEESADRQEDEIGDKDVKTHEAKGDPEMWKAVERAMKEGTLDDLRNSEVGVSHQPTKEHSRIKEGRHKKKQEKKTQSGITSTKDEDDESDGGFFE